MATACAPASASWITSVEAQSRLGCGHRALTRLVERGLIGVRRFPGVPGGKFYGPDVDRVALESVTPASRTEACG